MHASKPRFLSSLLLVLIAVGCGGKTESPPPPPATPAGPVVQSREVDYNDGTTPLKGFVAWDSAQASPRPGVLIVHEWWGHNEHARRQARRLAEAGYVGFALDMFGNGKNTTHPDSAQSFMMAAVKDQAVMVNRFKTALAELKKDPHVDSTRVAAIGYCFGGMVVLSMARAGEDLDAVASVHGAIPAAAKIDSGKVKARVLILTGGADPMVPQAQVDAFAAAMRKAGATVDVVTYPGVMHAFTNPRADSTGVAGLKYDSDADRQSWEALVKLLKETVG